MYENYPAVWLDIQDSDLRHQVEDILRRWQVKVTDRGVNPLSVGISDRVEQDAPDVVYIWNGERRPRSEHDGDTPFGCGFRRHWIGAKPEIDEWSFISTLSQVKSRHFLRLPELLGDGAYVQSWYARGSDERGSLLQRLEECFAVAKVRDHILQNLRQSLDELFTNAVYNAPSEDGKPLFSRMTRKEKVISPKPVLLQFGYTPHYAAIGVRDNYGTLPIQRVIDRWRRCWSAQGARFEDKDGGAGLGFFMLLERASRLAINVREGHFTEIVIMVRRKWSRKKTLLSLPTINLCVVASNNSRHDIRQHDRYPVEWEVNLISHDNEIKGTLLDISNSGAFVSLESGHQLKSRDVLVVRVRHPLSDETIELGATVRWLGRSAEHAQDGLGLQFHNLLQATEWIKQQSSLQNSA